jgi:hypothetical protein
MRCHSKYFPPSHFLILLCLHTCPSPFLHAFPILKPRHHYQIRCEPYAQHARVCVCVCVCACVCMRSPFQSLKFIKTMQIWVQFSFVFRILTCRRETWVRKKLSAKG